MTRQSDRDPDWWRRGLSRRALVVVVVICVLVIGFGLAVVAINGIRLF